MRSFRFSFPTLGGRRTPGFAVETSVSDAAPESVTELTPDLLGRPALPKGAPTTAEARSGLRAFRALRHSNFRLYIGGQLVSLAGTWMQSVAQGWLVYQLSGSPATLGIVGFASAIPVLLVGPWAGVVVDRVDIRRLLILTQVGAMLLAFALAVLTFTGLVEVWQVVVMAALLGVVNAFDGPARQSFVVEMVGKDDLPNAIALNSMAFNSARVIGPAFGGVLLATVGAAWCFTINGLSFLAVIVSLLVMHVAVKAKPRDGQSPWDQLKSGLSYVRYHPELRALLVLALFFSMFGISYMTVMPAFVDQVLHAGAQSFGLLTSCIGVGAVTGAFLVASFGDRGQRGRWLFGVALAFPFVLAAFGVNNSLPGAMLLALLLGVGFMTQFTLINTLLQTHVEDRMRGRVMALYTLSFAGFAPFGNLLVGWTAQLLGLSPALVLMATATLAGTLVIFWWTPQLRRLA